MLSAMKMSEGGGLGGVGNPAAINLNPAVPLGHCLAATASPPMTPITLSALSNSVVTTCPSQSPGGQMSSMAIPILSQIPSASPMTQCTTTMSAGGGQLQSGGSSASANTQNMADYLAQLIKDKKQLAIFPNLFLHVDRILDEEISRVRSNLFQLFGVKNEPLELPDACGPVISMSEKVYVPVKEYSDFNFVGRILGPRGMTAKQLEQETGCKIMVRGKGSMRDKKKEEMNRGKPNWEHLNDELHVLITVDDTENRGKLKLQRAIEEVGKLLVPVAEGEDELKKRQLMELAIINGTYRDSKESRNSAAVSNAGTPQLVTSQVPLSALRAGATPLGAPLIISPHHRLSNGLGAGTSPGGPQPLLAQTNESLLYAASPYTASDYATYLSLAEYSPDHVGKMSAVRRLTGLRDHPYLSKTDPSSLLH